MRLRWKEVKAFLEALEAAERYKPFQVAKRNIMRKYGLSGSRVDRLTTAIIYKIYRMQGVLDEIAAKVVGVKVQRLPPYLRQALRLAAYLALYDDSGDIELASQLVEAATRIAGKRFREQDAETIMRLYQSLRRGVWSPDPGMREEMRLLLPSMIIDRLKTLLGSMEEVEKFAAAVNSPKPSYGLRVNTLKATVEEVLDGLQQLGIHAEQSKRVPCHVRYYSALPYDKARLLLEGKAVPQEEASAAAAPLLDPRPGESVADLCAAPGGKTTHIAQIQGNKGTVIALEIFPDRMKRLYELAARTGTYASISPVLGDALRASSIIRRTDKVLLDPPCSSTGAIARHPEARWRLTPSTLRKLVTRQEAMIREAIRLLPQGGRLLYTVCSVLPEEGEYLVERILASEPVELIPLQGPYSLSPLLPGTMRAWPHRHETTGFFYALLEKR